jgi:hypothetical protein
MLRQKTDRAVLVPLNTWFGSSPDLMRRGIKTDLGALAEALIYYDQMFVRVENQEQFYALFNWFKESAGVEKLLNLMNHGELSFYHHNFLSPPVYRRDSDSYDFINIQEEPKDRLDSFRRHIVGGEMDRFFPTRRKLKSFWNTVKSGAVTVVDADVFGIEIEKARELLEPNVMQSMIVHLMESLHKAGFIDEIPDVKVWAEDLSSGGRRYHFDNLDFNLWKEKFGKEFNFGKHIPLAIASNTNRLLWSAANLQADLYTGSPTYEFLCDTLEETVKHFRETKRVLKRFEIDLEFPDIRSSVNQGLITASQVLRIREEAAAKFRTWLHKVADMERDEIVAYYNDFFSNLNLTERSTKYLKLAILVAVPSGSAAIGAQLSDPASAAIGTAVSTILSKMLYEKIAGGWTPKVFGNTLKRIVDM